MITRRGNARRVSALANPIKNTTRIKSALLDTRRKLLIIKKKILAVIDSKAIATNVKQVIHVNEIHVNELDWLELLGKAIDDITTEELLTSVIAGSLVGGFLGNRIGKEFDKGLLIAYRGIAKQSDDYAKGTSFMDLSNSAAKAKKQQLDLDLMAWQEFSAELKTKVVNIVKNAKDNGFTEKQLHDLIRDGFKSLTTKAQKITLNRLLSGYREAKLIAAELAEKQYGFKMVLLWVSALKPTTRPHHGSRHGKFYTIAEVKAFYSDVSNVYNCYCTIREVRVIKDKPVIKDSVLRRMKKEQAKWRLSQIR